MKISYIAYWDVSQESGVLKKIASQIRVWQTEEGQNNNEVKLFVLSPHTSIWPGIDDIPVDVTVDYGLVKRFAMFAELTQRVRAWQPDLVYLRFDRFYPALKALMKSIPTIVELNTDDLAELQMQSKLVYLYQYFTRGWVLKQASGIASVSHEIAEKHKFYQKPIIVLGNSINLAEYNLLPCPTNAVPRLVFIGTGRQPWHGIDKIVSLAQQFPNWQFDLIGPQKTDFDVVSPNLNFYGLLNRAEYEVIMGQANVAFGTLALHRKKMNEASPLKVREYLAFGIPTIIGYQDTDFPKSAVYLLQIPNTPTNIVKNNTVIESFVMSSKERRVTRPDISHIDIRCKERKRLEFFRRVIE